MNELIEKAKEFHTLTKDELVSLLANDGINDVLFQAADSVRSEFVGDEIHLRALIEFSNYCRCNCLYCGIRAENNLVERYRLEKSEILGLAQHAAASGYKTIVLQSGEDFSFKADYLAEIVAGIKKLDVAVTLSIGERS